MTIKLAVPSTNPGGLDAPLGMHFGHCDLYTIIEIEADAVKSVSTLPAIPHEQGGCLAPVGYLAEQGVQKMIAGGMGMRPLMGFNQAGIEVYHSGETNTVGESVQALLEGRLPVFSSEFSCGGH